MENKRIGATIVALSFLALLSILGASFIGNMFAKSSASYSVEVFDASFQNPVEGSIVESGRKNTDFIVTPGETVFPNSKITNTYHYPVHFRANYRIDITDEYGNVVTGLNDFVHVNMSEGWRYHDEHWYYDGEIEPKMKLCCPIASITYSDKFVNHVNCNVYVSMVVESVVANKKVATKSKGWSDIDISTINPHKYLS